MQRNIHRSIRCAEIFLFLALMFALVSCHDNGSTFEGYESDANIHVSESDNEVDSGDQENLEETGTPALNENDAYGKSADVGRAKGSDSETEKVTLEEGTEPEKTVDRSLFARLQDYERHGWDTRCPTRSTRCLSPWWINGNDNSLVGGSISGRFLLLGPEVPNTHCYYRKWWANPNLHDLERRHVDDIQEIVSPESNVVYDDGSGSYVAVDETFTAVASGESAIVEVGEIVDVRNRKRSEALFHSCDLSSDTHAFAIQSEDPLILTLELRPPNMPFEESTDLRCSYQYGKDDFQQICPEDVLSSCYYRVMRSYEPFLSPNSQYRFESIPLVSLYHRADVVDDRYTEIAPGESKVVRVGVDSIVHNCKIETGSVDSSP